jgi:hypothetical protein
MNAQGNRISNWAEYNKALVTRGSITFWISEDSSSSWYYDGKRAPGGRKVYSDHAVMICLTLKEMYSLTLRQTQGFVDSIAQLISDSSIKSPSYSQLCRRRQSISVKLSKKAKFSQNHCVLVDSTGIKIYGQTEWYESKYGKKQRQKWRKLHVLVDHHSQSILGAKLTVAYTHDATHFNDLINMLPKDSRAQTIIGDGCYSLHQCHDAADRYGAHLLAPPHCNALLQRENRGYKYKPATLRRDEAIEYVRKHETHELGLAAWKESVNYHRRSLVETAMFRLKTIFGEEIRAKNLHIQQQVMYIRCLALNKMTSIGMPSYL